MAQKKTKKNKAKSNFEEDKVVDAEVIEVEEASEEAEVEPEKESEKTTGKSLLFYFAAFLLVVSVFGFLGYKFLLGTNKDLEVLESQVDEAELVVLQQSKPRDEVAIEQLDMKYGDAIDAVEESGDAAMEAAEELVVAVQEAEISEPTPVIEVATVYKTDDKALDGLRGQVAMQNKNILLFLSAQNLQKILDSGVAKIDEKALRDEILFFKEISGGKAGYAGKTQLLEYSIEGGAPSIAELEGDLDVIVKKLESAEQKSFWQNFRESIFGLVKVTKLDAEVAGQEGDYAKILLAKKALQNQDFNTAIALVEKISGAQTESWKDKAYKLQRMHETVEYLLEATRQNLLESHRAAQ